MTWRLFFTCLFFCFTAKGQYSNIPTLEELSGIWLRSDTMSMEPSVRNFRAQALLNRDMTSLSWFASAPYAGGYHTGVLRINGVAPMASFFRWYPYQALRKTSRPTYALQSTVRMVPDQDLILWQLEISNPTAKNQTYDIEQDLIGFISRYANEKWPWKYPYTSLKGRIFNRTKEMINVRSNIGISPDSPKHFVSDVSDFDETDATRYKYPSDREILQSAKYHITGSDNTHLYIADNETGCVSAFALVDAPARITTYNSGGTASWSLRLKPGETKKIRFILSYAPSREEVTANLKKCENDFDQVFRHIPETWKKRWEAIFRPDNGFLSGTFPVLATDDKAVRRVYYTGPLTMLYLLNLNLPEHKRVYLTGGPRWGATTTFFWDITEWSTLFALVDPAMMKEQLRSWVHIDPSKYFGKDNYGGQGDGNGYVANYWALFQLMRSYITVSHDYDFLNEVIDEKKLIDHLEGYAYNWKRISIYGQPGCTDDIYKLADFGPDPWNLLECVPTYIHIVPSFNAGYVWMMRETAKFRRHLGDNARARQLDADAAEMAKRVLKLYAGSGIWNSWYPDNKNVEVRHVMDFMFLGKYMAGDMPDTMKKDMIRFVNDELMTDTWMRAQSLQDVAAKSSDRPDHGPLGAYDGWPAGTIDAMSQMGHTADALAFYRRLLPVTYEGCWAQAHELWGDNKLNRHARVRIPERGWTCRDASAGIDMSQNVIKDFFGFYPSIDGGPLHSTANSLNFTGTLYNVLYGGKYYNLYCRQGKVTMQPAGPFSGKAAPLSPPPFSVEAALEWTDLFKRSSGWSGADGIYSIPLHPDTTLLYFSDTMIGDSTDTGSRTPGNMVHNSVALLGGHLPQKEKIKFYWDKDQAGRLQSLFIPHTPSAQPDDYYWLGAGFFNQAKKATYLFAYKMRNLDPKDDWSFTLTKTNLIAIPAGSKPPFKDQRQIETPLSFQGASPDEKGTFGAAIFVSPDGYAYVYGIKGRKKSLLVARVRPENIEDFGQWRFWDGEKWNSDMQRSAPVTEGVSDELSLSPLPDGRYVLVFQQGGMGPTVAMRIGATPWGPFGEAVKLWECMESHDNKNYFTYNAKAHPVLSKPGELLISYNVNSFDFWKEIQKNPLLYRPRFLRLKFGQTAQQTHKDTAVTNFFRRTSGWVSSDGGYTIPLSNGGSLWLMGDSHIDDYDTATATVNCLFQVRNAALLQPAGDWDWHHSRTLTGNGPGIKSYLKNNPDDNFFTWPTGGIQLKDTVYIFCSSMKNARSDLEGFGFAHTGRDFLARIRFPDMKVAGYTPLQDLGDIGFGIGFIKNERWVYVYGQKMTGVRNDLFVARFPDTAPCGPWQFWNGSTWTDDIKEIKRIATQDGIDGTYQVCKVKDNVLLVSSELSVGCDQGKDIYTSVSGNITGPFSPRQRVYTIDDTLQGHYPFFYLAAAHPEFINDRKELLFTYSINGYGTCVPTCVNGRMDPDYYRIKAFRVPLKTLGIFGKN